MNPFSVLCALLYPPSSSAVLVGYVTALLTFRVKVGITSFTLCISGILSHVMTVDVAAPKLNLITPVYGLWLLAALELLHFFEKWIVGLYQVHIRAEAASFKGHLS